MYTVINQLGDSDHVFLVKDDFNRILVMKKLDLYCLPVYQYLKDHPVENTPLIYEVEENADNLTVIEEYIAGILLTDYVYRKGSLDDQESVDLIRQLCTIVNDLHNCIPPIIHRDIKPDNIIITEKHELKLLDMNAAKFFDNGSSGDTYLLGTYGYAAPEQYGFGKASVVSDIYGIGKVFNFMLTGDINIPAKGNYEGIIEKCTEIDPVNRYRNIDELLKDLKHEKTLKINYNRLPGFRGDTLTSKILAVIGYILFFMVMSWMGFEGLEDPFAIWLNRIGYTIIALIIFLFSLNYRYVWRRFGIYKIENGWRRRLAICLWDLGIMMLGIIMNGIIVDLILRIGGKING